MRRFEPEEQLQVMVMAATTAVLDSLGDDCIERRSDMLLALSGYLASEVMKQEPLVVLAASEFLNFLSLVKIEGVIIPNDFLLEMNLAERTVCVNGERVYPAVLG